LKRSRLKEKVDAGRTDTAPWHKLTSPETKMIYLYDLDRKTLTLSSSCYRSRC